MSDHVFTVDDIETVSRIVTRCHDADRPPAAVSYVDDQLTLTFSPDLTPQETTVLEELVRAAKVGLTRAERNAIESDVATLRAFQGIASPTLAQTAAAVKAQTRVLRAILRD